jgi:hypothetical protein
MTKKKIHKREQEAVIQNTPVRELIYSKYFSEKSEKLIAVLLAIISILTGIYFLIQAKTANGFFCFPLDDSWIHLTFARNLVEYGSFSYYKNQLATSGSTSPVYTLLLSVLYLFSKNEFIISYILGIIFLALTVFTLFHLLKVHFHKAMWLAVIAALLAALQPRLNLISVSGMETTMFICLLVVSLYNYKRKNYVLLGVSLGLLLWCRPDGLIMWVAIIVDHVFSQIFVSNKGKKPVNAISLKELYKPFIIALGFAAVYVAFNYMLSGSPFPNTFRSKLATYQHNSRSIFLNQDVIKDFTSSEFVIIWIPFLISCIIILRDLIKKQYNGFSIYLIFISGFIFTYWWLLPFSFSYGRYLLPVIPFYIVLSVYGIKLTLEYFAGNIKSPVPANIFGVGYFAAAIILSVVYLNSNSDLYTYTCKYFNERHVTVGKWIAKNTPVNAVIATHDIGAIEFYGNRKLIDMVGLVSPEILDKMDVGFIGFLNNYLAQKKPDYLIVLKNWFEVVNDNPILVPVHSPEIMEVYKYKTNQTHILAGEVSRLIRQAGDYIQKNDKEYAERYLLQALADDPVSSKTDFYLAYFYDSAGNKVKGEEYLKRALVIFPDFTDANFMMASVEFTKNNYSMAKVYLERCLKINPDYSGAKELMYKVKDKL